MTILDRPLRRLVLRHGSMSVFELRQEAGSASYSGCRTNSHHAQSAMPVAKHSVRIPVTEWVAE